MSRRSRLSRLVFGLMLVLILSVGFIETKTRIIRRALDDVIWDNKNHYLSCAELPTVEEVESVLTHYQADLAAIEQVNPGFVGFEIDTASCPGKADILIWYGSHNDRMAIEKMIQGERLFGIPYRLQNR